MVSNLLSMHIKLLVSNTTPIVAAIISILRKYLPRILKIPTEKAKVPRFSSEDQSGGSLQLPAASSPLCGLRPWTMLLGLEKGGIQAPFKPPPCSLTQSWAEERAHKKVRGKLWCNRHVHSLHRGDITCMCICQDSSNCTLQIHTHLLSVEHTSVKL